ncbi:hypothetical protein BLA24064_01229 [Burkholderia latens]|uniref:Uncharacterized protein n=1 Tax=Burkholderia latens TaxID=488446 RepID=A0A6P2IGY0_9BURK|nr:hypothetical protein BLA24064_01229 [Burkholderia latens]
MRRGARHGPHRIAQRFALAHPLRPAASKVPKPQSSLANPSAVVSLVIGHPDLHLAPSPSVARRGASRSESSDTGQSYMY